MEELHWLGYFAETVLEMKVWRTWWRTGYCWSPADSGLVDDPGHTTQVFNPHRRILLSTKTETSHITIIFIIVSSEIVRMQTTDDDKHLQCSVQVFYIILNHYYIIIIKSYSVGFGS